MQPMGRKPLRFPGKVDHHIKGYRNWWEGEGTTENKKAARKEGKSETLHCNYDKYDNPYDFIHKSRLTYLNR